MEVQTFFLCQELRKVGQGNEWDASRVAINNFYPLDGNFPLKFTMPYYLILRREQRIGDEDVTLRFNLVDIDGRKIGQPNDVLMKGIFPNGHRFMYQFGNIEFFFPKMGDFRLDITSDEQKLMSLFSYCIEISDKKP